VRGWFESRDRRWLFSFERICEALDLDSDTSVRPSLKSALEDVLPIYPR